MEVALDTLYNVMVNGCEYNVYANRYEGEVEVYDCNNERIAHATLNDDTEQAFVYYFSEGKELMDHRHGSSDLYFENTGKTDYDLAHDVGRWLVETHPI